VTILLGSANLQDHYFWDAKRSNVRFRTIYDQRFGEFPAPRELYAEYASSL
jgi:hypothetical protein